MDDLKIGKLIKKIFDNSTRFGKVDTSLALTSADENWLISSYVRINEISRNIHSELLHVRTLPTPTRCDPYLDIYIRVYN